MERSRVLRLSSLALAAAIVALCACSRQPQITAWGCTASPEVEAAWRSFEDPEKPCGHADLLCWRRKFAASRAMRVRYPQELLAHRLLVTQVIWAPRELPEKVLLRESLREEYAELSRRHPRNPTYPYLLARLEENRRQRRKLNREALSRDPAFAWAHDALVKLIPSKPTDGDRIEARKHLEAFARACPERTGDRLTLLWYLDDRSAWHSEAPALRAAIKAETGRFRELPRLWELEFKFGEPSDFAALRESARLQVEVLRRLDRQTDREWLSAVAEGYKLTGDEVGKTWVEEVQIARFPCSWEAMDAWYDGSQRRGKIPEAEGAAKQEWLVEELLAIAPQLAKCPEDSRLWQTRFYYLAQMNTVEPELLETAGDRVLELQGERASGRVAKAFIDKRVRLDRAEALLEIDQRRIEEGWKESQAEGLKREELQERRPFYLYEKRNNQALRASLALAYRDAESARRALASFKATLDEIEESARKPSDLQELAWQQAEYWGLCGEADALAGRDEAALEDYGRSLAKYPDNEKVRKAARETYVRIHGRASGFDGWQTNAESTARTASEEITKTARRLLPDLQMPDLSGRKWTSADLRGKAVLLNFWATWCGPCLSELPHVQKLYERSRKRSDVAIVTVSIDDNPGLIGPFLKREKYAFPVLVAGAAAYEKWTPGGIPQTYIVDPDGTIVEEHFGFGGDGDAWMRKMEASLQAALAGSRKEASAANP